MTKISKSGTLSTRRPPKEVNVLEKLRHLHGLDKIRIHPHANQRMGERNVIYYEVLQALSKAKYRPSKDRFSEEHQSWEYCMEGDTIDSKTLRIGIAFEIDEKTNERVLIITVIDINE